MDSRSKAFVLAADLAKTRNNVSTPSWLMVPPKTKSGCVRSNSSREMKSELDVRGMDSMTAKALLVAHRSLKKEMEKKELKKIKLLSFEDVPSQIVCPKKNVPKKQCAAKTMNGKPCPFAATQGKFCKKHKIVDKDIF